MVIRGQEQITVRRGSVRPTEVFGKLEKNLCEKFDLSSSSDIDMEQKVISYALYPKVYEEYCEHLENYNDVSHLESHVYFYGLREGEETVLNMSEGKDLIIKYTGKGPISDEGVRTLLFEINGQMREINVVDKNQEVLADRKLKADKNNPGHLGSTIPGTVAKVLVKEGDEVTVNMPLMTVEAMKMETTVVSRVAGKVDKIYVAEGDRVSQDDLLISFEIAEEE